MCSLPGTNSVAWKRYSTPRNRVSARHRNTNFIGAHIAMNPRDLATVAAWLDEQPESVDRTASRISELGRQPFTASRFLSSMPIACCSAPTIRGRKKLIEPVLRFFRTKRRVVFRIRKKITATPGVGGKSTASIDPTRCCEKFITDAARFDSGRRRRARWRSTEQRTQDELRAASPSLGRTAPA